MLNRWFAAPRAGDDSPVKEADFIVLPAAASDSWRSWLMTGVRRGPFDRRRLKGAHQGLKKLMIEGSNGSDDHPKPWNDFSSAMVRQSVDEALNALPPDKKQAVKLAYFGGFTNREIAQQLGVAESGVRRLLHDALEFVSAYVERGRVAASRIVYAIVGWLGARAVFDAVQRSSSPAVDQVLQAAAVVTVGVVAAAVLVANPVSPTGHHDAQGGGVQSVQPAAPARTNPVDAVKSVAPAAPTLPAVSPPAVVVAPQVPPLPVTLPVTLPATLPTPTISLPDLPKP
jgi:RNA polymerase sigma factor (sigma-70 family)